MHIVGGTYRELCEHPYWDRLLGSGGRAAYVFEKLSPGSHFYTYLSEGEKFDSLNNITIHTFQRSSRMVFAYFHPLSKPIIQPPLEDLHAQETIEVEGDIVLRFGFLEGDAKVKARKAVYDPQTWRYPSQFFENNSECEELVVVLNELELINMMSIDDIDQAAFKLLEIKGTSAVIVKRGALGAIVYDKDKMIHSIPVYKSNCIFKIGTGDVFSAVFAFYWGEKNMSPSLAADLASRAVSIYTETRYFEFNIDSLKKRVPIIKIGMRRIVILACKDSLGQKYMYEEAIYILKELGIETLNNDEVINVERLEEYSKSFAILVINTHLDKAQLNLLKVAIENSIPIVVLDEFSERKYSYLNPIFSTNDFSTAMYFSVWASLGS